MKNKIFALITILILTLSLFLVATIPVAAAGTTWYVATTGTNDVTHGTGPGANAFATIDYVSPMIELLMAIS